MPDPAYQYSLAFTAATVTLNTNTRIARETAAAARLVFFRYLNVKGKDGIKVGEEGRSFELEGWLHSDSEVNLETAKAVIQTAAKNAEVAALSYRGAASSIGNCIIGCNPPPEFSEHYWESATSVGCMYRLVIDQLVVD